MSDLISRQAAIDALRTCYDTETVTMSNGDEYINYEDAVGEIEQLPSAQPETHDERTETRACDCISRQAAIDAVLDRMNVEKHGRDAKPEEIQWALEKLPSAQPEIIHCRDCKHWREGDAYSYCQKLFNCGVLDVYDYMRADDDFCSEAERRTNG